MFPHWCDADVWLASSDRTVTQRRSETGNHVPGRAVQETQINVTHTRRVFSRSFPPETTFYAQLPVVKILKWEQPETKKPAAMFSSFPALILAGILLMNNLK